MKKFSSKALLGALTTMGTIATFGFTQSAHATVSIGTPCNNATCQIPVELNLNSSNSGVASITAESIVFNQSVAAGNTVTFTLSNATFNSVTISIMSASSGGVAICSDTLSTTTSSATCAISTPYSITAGTQYYLSPYTIQITSSAPGTSVVLTATDPYESGSAVLFTSYSNYSIGLSSSTYYIASSLTTFTTGSNTAINNITISSNSNANSLTLSSGSLNVLFTNIPNSVTLVATSSSSRTPGNNSATFASLASLTTIPLVNGSTTYSFTFSNTGNIGTGTIDATVYTSSVSSAAGSSATISSSSASYTYTNANATPFLTFTPSSIQIYGEVVAPVSGYAEYLQISLPSNVSMGTLQIGGATCTPSYYSSSTSGTVATYTIDLVQTMNNCSSVPNVGAGNMLPLTMTFNSSSNLNDVSQIAAQVVAWNSTGTFIRHFPLTIYNPSSSSGSLKQISY